MKGVAFNLIPTKNANDHYLDTLKHKRVVLVDGERVDKCSCSDCSLNVETARVNHAGEIRQSLKSHHCVLK